MYLSDFNFDDIQDYIDRDNVQNDQISGNYDSYFLRRMVYLRPCTFTINQRSDDLHWEVISSADKYYQNLAVHKPIIHYGGGTTHGTVDHIVDGQRLWDDTSTYFRWNNDGKNKN